MRKTRKRFIGGVMAFAVGTSILGGTAGAHVLTVENRKGVVHEGWVGAGGAAHKHGLVSACQAHREHGHSAALIDTPWNSPENCEHGGA